MQDFYSVLQVTPKASDAEIKSAFRNLAKTCHPDVRPGDREAEQTFQEAKRAYRFLTNPETRRMYDAYLADRRAARRLRIRRAAATMTTTFVLTAATIILAMLWLRGGSLPFGAGSLLAKETPGAMAIAHAPAQAPASEEKGGPASAPPR